MGWLDTMSAGAGSLLSGGVNFLGDVVGGIATGIFNHGEARRDRNFKREMYQRAVDDQIKFWNMQNEYDLPSAQLQRLMDANLSPLLMYGEGGISGNLAAGAPSMPSVPSGSQASANFNTSIDMANIALANQQMNESKSREYLNYKEAENREADTGLKGLQGEQLKIETDYSKDSYQLRLDMLKAEKDLKDSMFYLNYSQANKLNKEISYLNKQIENIDSEIAARNELTQAQVNKMAAEVEQGWQRLTGELALMNAQARNALANAYAATVNANIAKNLYSPEYIKILQGEAGQQFLNAIRSGDAQLLQNGLLAKEFEMTAGYDSTAGKIKFWCDNVVKPITGIISDVAVTAGGVGIAAKSFQGLAAAPQMGKIGF